MLSRLLDEYRSVREQRFASTSSRAQAAVGLLVVGLQQRLLSSIEAFARSLRIHRKTVERQWSRGQVETAARESELERQTELFTSAPGADDERGGWSGEELEAQESLGIEAVTAATETVSLRDEAAQSLWQREQALLEQLEGIAEKARYLPDAKARRLIDWIRQEMCPEMPTFGQAPSGPAAMWNDRRVLIFTENREGTKRWLQSILEQAIAATDGADERIGVITGLTSGPRVAEEELEQARDRQDDLRRQIERRRTLLERSRGWTGVKPEPFRNALSCSLELLGAEPLARAGEEDG